MRIISGSKRGKKLHLPPDKQTRPLLDRIKEALFSMLYPNVPGKTVADYYAGSGSFGLEAISREADHVLFVEQDKAVLKVLRKNISETGFGDRSTVYAGDVFQCIQKKQEMYKNKIGIMFFDPPFADVTENGFISEWNTNAVQIHSMMIGNGHVIVRVPSFFKGCLDIEGLFCTEKDRTYGRSRVIIMRSSR